MYIKYHKWELRVFIRKFLFSFFFMNKCIFFFGFMHFLYVKVAMDTQFDFKRNSLGVLFNSWIFLFIYFFEWWWGRGLYTVQEFLETSDGVISGNPLIHLQPNNNKKKICFGPQSVLYPFKYHQKKIFLGLIDPLHWFFRPNKIKPQKI